MDDAALIGGASRGARRAAPRHQRAAPAQARGGGPGLPVLRWLCW